ncbi:hypothetical protein U1Q18_047690, partial [Sarracenia purpurea var. burkii]
WSPNSRRVSTRYNMLLCNPLLSNVIMRLCETLVVLGHSLSSFEEDLMGVRHPQYVP